MADAFINSSVNDEEMLKAVKKLQNNKAARHDEVLNEHISATVSLFLPLYNKLHVY